jgi:hypothetical protein
MFRLKIVFPFLSIAVLVFGIGVFTKLQALKVSEKEQYKLSAKNSNSDTAVSYQTVAKFKTHSRKKEYRNGELISIDLAMLNKSPNPLRLLDLEYQEEIIVRDLQGNKIKSFSFYSFPSRIPSYTILNSGEYASTHLVFSVGCSKERSQFKNMEEEFNKDAFTYNGQGCIEIKESGKYLLSAKISNSDIETDKTTQTAVGTMESTPFEINVVE